MRRLTEEEEERLIWRSVFASGKEIELPDPRRDCPWKCRKDDPECLCARAAGQGAMK